MTVVVVKKSFFSTTIAPVQVFQVVKTYYILAHKKKSQTIITHGEEFAQCFAGKIGQINSDLDAIVDIGPVNVILAPACPLWVSLLVTFIIVYSHVPRKRGKVNKHCDYSYSCYNLTCLMGIREH